MNPEDINPKLTIGKAAVETLGLIRYLEATEIGQIVTHLDMQDACKADIKEHPGFLQTARRSLLKRRIAFGTIIGIGIKRLSNDEIPNEAHEKIKRSRRIARKGLSIVACANLADLQPEDRFKAITTTTILGFMAGAGSRKIQNLTEQSVRNCNGEMKIGDISTLFKNPS